MFGMDYEETKKMDLELLDKLRGTSVDYQIYHEYWQKKFYTRTRIRVYYKDSTIG